MVEVKMTVSEFVENYEFRGESDYTPSDKERVLIEDAIEGYRAHLAALAPASEPVGCAVDALAQAWASIDGKLNAYERERDLSVSENYGKPDFTGAFAGYQAEALEMIQRLRSRGFDVVAAPPAPAPEASDER